jgi:hypothetical protein
MNLPRRRGLGRSTRTREGNALVQPEPPSIAAATLTRWFPGPSSGATPIRSGSRRPFTRRGGPPRGGSSLRARSTHAPGASRVSSWIPTSPDDFCNLSRPADTSANPDPRAASADILANADHPQVGRAPRTAGGGRAPVNRGGRALAADPDPPPRPSTLRRRPALSRTGSGPRSLSTRPRPRFPHRHANERCVKGEAGCLPSPAARDGFPSAGSDRETVPSWGDWSRSAPLSPPGVPALTGCTLRSGSVGGGWGVLPITAQPTAAPR